MAYIKKSKIPKVKTVRPKKIKPIKEKPVKIKDLGKNKKLAKVNIKPENMGLVFFSETISTDKDGEPTVIRQVKMNKGQVIRETLYNIKKDEIEYKIREV
jgi:hypothetical protein